MDGLSKLFYAEAQVIAFERGINDQNKKISYAARASLWKDISILFKNSA